MVLDVDVLGSTMIHRILRHLYARLVILEDDKFWSQIIGCLEDLTQQSVNPFALLDGQT